MFKIKACLLLTSLIIIMLSHFANAYFVQECSVDFTKTKSIIYTKISVAKIYFCNILMVYFDFWWYYSSIKLFNKTKYPQTYQSSVKMPADKNGNTSIGEITLLVSS